MEIHHYSSDTGEYIGTSSARPDILESEIQKKEVFILPANTTVLPPPRKISGRARVFARGVWGEVSDYRGQTWFDADGNTVSIRELGPTPDGLTEKYIPSAPPVLTLVEQAEADINKTNVLMFEIVEKLLDVLMLKNTVSMDDFDVESQTLISKRKFDREKVKNNG